MATAEKASTKDKLLYGGAFVAVIILLWLMFRSQSSTTPTTATTTPATNSGMFYPPTMNGMAPLSAMINVSFTPVANTNEPTGYVPLFGFIGYGGQWE